MLTSGISLVDYPQASSAKLRERYRSAGFWRAAQVINLFDFHGVRYSLLIRDSELKIKLRGNKDV